MSEIHPPWAPARSLSGANYSAVELAQTNDLVYMMDQRELPTREVYVTLTTLQEVADAIRTMVVRGAPAIGISAAYGMVLAARALRDATTKEYVDGMLAAAKTLMAARPTAVNLFWAAKRMFSAAETQQLDPFDNRLSYLAFLSRKLHEDDVRACKLMGGIGAKRFPDGSTILTHCNAGALATGGYGTALGVIRAVKEEGKRVRVLADETRPYLQGARLTAWELHADGIDVEVITDSMAAYFMKRGEVTGVVVGADRIAKNGDVANKIGTYGLACLAKHHGIPFYVAAPWTTVDLQTETGDAIVIEERSRDEVVRVGSTVLVPADVPVRHPAFDVTPASLITAIFTERGEHVPSDIGLASGT